MVIQASKNDPKRAKSIYRRLMSTKVFGKDKLDAILGITSSAREPEQMRGRDSVEFLNDGDYLHALLGNITPKRRALRDCQELIARLGGLLEVFNASLWQLEATCDDMGLGFSGTYVRRRLDSALMMEQRLWLTRAKIGPVANNFRNITQYLVKSFSLSKQEEVRILGLDKRHVIIGSNIISIGRTNYVHVEIREILACALRTGAEAFIISHNHLNGQVEASETDVRFTRQIEGAALMLGMKLFDHIIVSGSDWFSFRVAGLLETIGDSKLPGAPP
jgi:DNA repair protein RadC